MWGSLASAVPVELGTNACIEAADGQGSTTLLGAMSRDGVSLEATEILPLETAEPGEAEKKEEDDQDPKGGCFRQSPRLTFGFCTHSVRNRTTLVEFSKRRRQLGACGARAPPA